MTIRPVRISRVTRFSLSTSFCISLNFGMETENTTPIKVSTAITAAAIIHDMETS